MSINNDLITKINPLLLNGVVGTTTASGTNTITTSNALKYRPINLSVDGKSEQKVGYMYVCDGTETGDYYYTYSSISYQFTMPTVTSGDYILFDTNDKIFYKNGTTAITTTQASTGTLLTMVVAPNPDYPQTMTAINNNVTICDKNLYDGTRTTNAYSLTYTLDTEKIVVNGTPTAATKFNGKNITLPPGTYRVMLEHISGDLDVSQQTSESAKNLPFYIYVGGTWETKATIGHFVTTSTRASKTFTLTKSTSINIGVFVQKNNIYNNYTVKYQIVRGSIADYNFEPYRGVTIALGGISLYNNMPNTVADELIIDTKTGIVKKISKITKKRLNRNIGNWYTWNTSTYYCLISGNDTEGESIYCNMFKASISSSNHLNISNAYDSGLTTLSDFLTFLDNNEVYVYYRLATPTIETITTLSASDLEKLNLATGTNTINLVANLDSTINMEYISF